MGVTFGRRGSTLFALDMMKQSSRFLLAATLLSSVSLGHTADAYMGDWQGTITTDGKTPRDVAVYMIPRGGGRYDAKIVSTFDRRGPTLHRLQGRIGGGKLSLIDAIPFDPLHVLRATDDGIVVRASLWSGGLTDGGSSGSIDGLLDGAFQLKQSKRLSPTLGKAPPAGAVILFDGSNLDAWMKVGEEKAKPGWKLLGDREMEVKGGDIVTKRQFRDHQLHVEFRLPYMPHATGQGRANSGVYLQGRYEVQVLDSYGLEGEDNECGGIYQVSRPIVNMCAPPLQWQTYDITFRAARFTQGKKTENARITVVHNGVVIHENLELPKATGGAIDADEKVPGGLKLQDHGNPVRFRNIWALER